MNYLQQLARETGRKLWQQRNKLTGADFISSIHAALEKAVRDACRDYELKLTDAERKLGKEQSRLDFLLKIISDATDAHDLWQKILSSRKAIDAS